MSVNYYRRVPARPLNLPQPPNEPLSAEALRVIGQRHFTRRYVMSPGVPEGTVWMWQDDIYRTNTFPSEDAARAYVAMFGIEDRVDWRL